MKSLLQLAFLAVVAFAVYEWKGKEWLGQQSPPSPPTPAEPAPEFVRRYSHSLAFVEGKGGKGSGFIGEMGGKKFVFTNQHVVAGNAGAILTLLDQTRVKTGAAAAAAGHDIMSLELLSDGVGMKVMRDVLANTTVGDDVAVLGNSNGERVIKPLMGKLVGVGPDRIEVSAEFVTGNSGSPIVHLKSGEVIGIATYAKIRKIDSITGKLKAEPEVRRFGYRLDSVKQWQPVNWQAYDEDFHTLEKINARTTDLLRLLTARDAISMSALDYKDSAIRNPLMRFANGVRGKGLIKTDFASAAKDLIGSLRTSCDSDIVDAQARLRYEYFRRELHDHQQLREQFYKEFDRVMKILYGR